VFALYVRHRCGQLTTCSVDVDTASAMQNIIGSEFRDCTVLAVMHRRKHVACYDTVALLGDGELLEYSKPESLIVGDTRFAEPYKLNAH
jgi:ATP-binding cassette, subfamily C (CFTR/MRP), member 1